MKWLKRAKLAMNPGRAPRPGAAPRRRVDWRSWDPIASRYEQAVAPHTAQAYESLLALADPVAGARLLDVGCGTGFALPVATARGLRAVGCDPSTGMLAAGRAVRPDAPLVAADTINLPYRDASFDVVTASFCLQLVRKIETALFDIKRVLKPGGVLVVAVWDAGIDDLTRTWLTLAEESLGVEMFRHARRDAEPYAEVLADKGRLEAALRDAGFRPVTVTRTKLRLEMSLDDYITAKAIEPLGRFAHSMLDRRWDDFTARVRAAYEGNFGGHVVDLRDVLIASATRPR